MGWGLAARAKAALLQGIFLALLGLGVIGSTAYRVFVEHEPQTLLMGSFALVAFVVNVLAAVVLIPHRKGDANVAAFNEGLAAIKADGTLDQLIAKYWAAE